MIENIGSDPISEAKIEEYNKIFATFYQEYKPHGPKWMGIMPMQWPLDLFMYQEIMVEVKPTLIIETGTLGGATPLFLNDIHTLMQSHELVDSALRIITIDIEDRRNNQIVFPDNIIFILGNSLEVAGKVEKMINPDDCVMVLLDSEHSLKHTLAEMELYGPFVTWGSYMIVQDGWIDLYHNQRNGALGAIEQYLSDHDDFAIEYRFQRWVTSQHHKGWLKKVK